MVLTPEKLKIICNATIDEEAFQRVVSLFEEDAPTSSEGVASSVPFIFNLDSIQVKLLSAVMNAIPAVIFMKDVHSRLIMANQACLDMNHCETEDELLGKTDFDFLADPKEAQIHFDMEQEIFHTGNPVVNMETHYIDIDGTSKWYLASKSPLSNLDGKIVGLVGIIRDITPQKLAEKSLENERNLLQTLIDHVQDKIYIKDRDSRFIVANAETLRAQQVSSEELLGSTDFDYMPPERAQRMFDEEQIIMASGQSIINQELHVPSDTTKEDDMWFLISKVPIYDDNGVVSGVVGVNHDITNIKQAEQEATELKLERERSKILADFITDSSHEFRTPISVIQTSTYLLERVDDPNKRQQYASRITQQTDRLMNLLDSLLLMSRLDRETHIKTDSIYLQSFLKNMIDRFQSKLLDKSQDIHLINHNPQMRILCNEEFLAIAVSMILDNAIRYTPDNGEITIQGYTQENKIIITIQDTGIGMIDETRIRIFERFYRADEAHSTSGIGLGLPIAKRIIELHDGTIEVESQIETGSVFSMIFPQSSTHYNIR